MKPTHLIALTALLVSCSTGEAPEPTSLTSPATTVTLTHAVQGSIEETTTYPAVVTYLNKTDLAAPIAGFVSESRTTVGTAVSAGQTLFRLASKEQHALQTGDNISVACLQSGIVISVATQAGNYVAEGQALCTVAEAASRVFEISVPCEQMQALKHATHCTLLLPDGTRYTANVAAPLATMDEASQTLRVVARARTPFLPEGMRLQAQFHLSTSKSATLLVPKEAVQSDAALTAHWVMKLRDDSTAVRVPVTIGRADSTHIEILAPTSLTTSDRIVLTGAYGLMDGARVRY